MPFLKLFCRALVACSALAGACAQDSSVAPAFVPGIPAVSRAPRVPGRYTSIATARPFVALTFDDGPHPELTPRLLDILRYHGVRATFFVVGRNAELYPDIVRRIVAEGHEIANHSYTHTSLTTVGDERLRQEVCGTSDAIERITGRRPTSMRPPYGANNARVQAFLQSQGLDMVLWSVDPLDWKRPGPEIVAQRLVQGAKPGAILLSHDIHPGTVDAIGSAIEQLKAKGYGFATVGQLISLRNPGVRPGETVQEHASMH